MQADAAAHFKQIMDRAETDELCAHEVCRHIGKCKTTDCDRCQLSGKGFETCVNKGDCKEDSPHFLPCRNSDVSIVSV